MASKTIQVRGAGKDRKIVLWEKDPAHPNGEVVVSNDGKAHEVGETAQVKRLIGDGRLVAATTQAAPISRTQTPPTQTQGGNTQGNDKPAAPWEGFDDASAEEVIERLRGMEPDAREQALAYERGNKNRTTITRVNWNG